MRQQSEGVGCGQSTVFPRPRKKWWRLRRIREDASLQRVGGELMPEGGEVWWHVRSRAEERQLCGVCRWQLVALPLVGRGALGACSTLAAAGAMVRRR